MQKYTVPIILIIILLLIGSVAVKTIRQFKESNILSTGIKVEATPTPLRLPNGTITETEYGRVKYLVFGVKIPNLSKISLIANFSEKFTGEKLVKENNCDLGINGGFYQGNEQPLGLFFSGEKQYGKIVKSSIANSFVWQDKAGDLRFIRTPPVNFQFTDFIFQTGPYIFPNKNQLRLIRDERARRSLLGKDFQGNLYFISITKKDNLDAGPHLADLPVIFWQLKEGNIFPLEELVNLDGGSASFFYSRDEEGNLTLSSWAPIGSLICVRWEK
ncbi:hypothetical protein A2W14_05695 [Candidatus Gottesmanbacteria bacterium RBG_16_37_8]|uniref:Phosphodiester glycosidase domain-containing protein n=1 Tax=Candidatus Gottesmanbacteria bacterium RBG_16_37_8 TaxID=1798371 RepID=A0A1F5YUM8_9BACT|nr:MAG: hypothetical protein A2W14_05695 [Candidatus Gottesmanbacteria bacterium RBG_16_37_8]